MLKINYINYQKLSPSEFRDYVLAPILNESKKTGEIIIVDFEDFNLSQKDLDTIFGEYIRKYKDKGLCFRIAIISTENKENIDDSVWRKAIKIIDEEVDKL